ncbi:MAG: hypothetical protein H0U12_13585 [Thermoleophilaceae bacterium]|nr:hypothetical protein [Thermoleophilaceae bacterium]
MAAETPAPAQADGDGAADVAAQAAADPAAVRAAVEKAIAGAAQAKADAEKAVADARSARAKADDDERDAAQKATPLALQQREAEARKAAAEANKAAAVAQRDQLGAFIPDFSKVQRGELELKGDQTLDASALAQRAVAEAADTLAKRVEEKLPDDGRWRLLITSDSDLATSDGAYLDVVTGLDQLSAAADKLLEIAQPAKTKEFLGPAIGALVSAVPGLLSLFSAHRTVMTAPVTISDLTAAAATVGALRRLTDSGVLIHDDLRLLPKGAVHGKAEALGAKQQELVGHKIALEADKARSTAELAEARAKVSELTAALAANPDNANELRPQVAEELKQLESLEQKVDAAAIKVGLIESVLSAIDHFITSLTAVPEGGKRSPLALAAMREQLHEATAGDHPFTHVLLVKGNAGSAQQSVDDRPLWFDDKYSAVATASITYMLLETETSQLVTADNVTGSAAAYGKIRDEFEVKVEARPLDPSGNGSGAGT